MDNLNDSQHFQSILILTGYRMSYRTKFSLINPERAEMFTNLLRVVKQWAKARQIYSNIFGYLSGTILLIMSAKICLLYPNGNLLFLLRQFFLIYSIWHWPIPVILDSLVNSNNIFQNWNLKNLLPSEYHDGDKMPVITSLFPNQNAAYNVNNHTLNIIKVEINRECTSFKDINDENQKEFASVSPPNCGHLKTRIRTLLYRWVEKTVIQTKNKQTVILKDRLNNYHALSGYARKRRMYNKR
uniref:polynucleotide adenylyltransferase n=1 Tax=Meloidogyne enterolobii TaxID=390850 RepID=A0A6V7X0R2_MELEN|nr:unnamed protein product [Meloidogyne enterolobii]